MNSNKKTSGTTQSCPYDDDEILEEPRVSIRACLYFDGTGNNRTNVDLGLEGSPMGLKVDKGSYQSDHSNVSKLEKKWLSADGVDHDFSLYVEGIGTTNGELDDLIGGGLGKGSTGVISKVESGIKAMIQNIIPLVPNKKISHIYLDSCGFSRGAAAARYYVYAIMKKSGETLLDQLKAKGFDVNSVKFKFVGLFDTVASIGMNHDTDTKKLHMDNLNITERVVQLSASEEHRKNFRLTGIESAKNGLEVFMPGVHSDIGGSYNKTEEEKDLQILDFDRVWGLSDDDKEAFKRERNWLVDSGWYKEEEIEDVNFFNELKVNRKGIKNEYSFIPLQMMADYAKEYGVHYSGTLVLKYKVPTELKDFQSYLKNYAKGPTKPSDWHLDIDNKIDWNNHNDGVKYIRNKYFHFSSYYGSIGMAPQWTSDDPVKGKRKRKIQKG